MRIKRVLAIGLALMASLILAPALAVTTAIQLENYDPFCASCHTEPESGYVLRTHEEPVDLASAHAQTGVRCIDCHSGEGAAGRAASLAQGAADLLAFLQGSYEQPARTHRPLGDAACLKCHLPADMARSGAQSSLNVSHYHLASYLGEWQNRAADSASRCGQCHEPHALAGSPGQRFVDGAVLNPACEACHTALSGWIPVPD
jgi:hypothetical protein